MADAPQLFDRRLVRARLARALAGPYPAFLLERAVEDLDDRLAAVTRTFPRALDLGTPLPLALPVLRAAGAVGEAVRLGPGGAGGLDIVGDEESLPFAPESFNLVVSLLSLHAVNDVPGTFAQVRRILAPDGLFLACLLGGESLRELRAAFAEAESEREGGASPRVAPFADARAVGGLLQRAGFALPVVDVDRVVARYPTPFALMADLRAMGLANALVERRRTPLRRATLLRAAEIYGERFADPDGRVRATFDLVWLSGWAPHESQQKPLRPGSARSRLADALGVPELGPDIAQGDPP
jgi:SAM-dependent methyltransferase